MKTVVIGAGPAGLAAAHTLANNNRTVKIIEKSSTVGGLSKTILYKGFRFDLGGHRFWTKNKEVDKFVKALMGDELIRVPRTSRILLNKKFFEYPLRATNALFGLGIVKSFQILGDYLFIKIKNLYKPNPDVSFEDWIINRFGKTMHTIYFKPYTEKMWGVSCRKLSADWAAQRIRIMSLRIVVKDALFKPKKCSRNLIKEFVFPKLGIGRLSERLSKNIKHLYLNSTVTNLKHKNNRITSVEYHNAGRIRSINPDNIISTMPITELINVLDPKPPRKIIEHAKALTFINGVFVFMIIDKSSVTGDSWLYFPDKDTSFIRIHEPKNWSEHMTKPGKTSILAEYTCKEGDSTWNERDEELVKKTINDLEKLGFIKKQEIIDSCVVRVKKTYPLYEIGYANHLNKIKNYLKKFENLQTVGRSGTFRYNNLDHSIENGIKAAENLMGKCYNLNETELKQKYLE